MPDIDLSKIRVGDAVRVRYQSARSGAGPVEITGQCHMNYAGKPCLGPVLLEEATILEHIPDRPDWTDAMVIKDTMGDVWARNLDGSFHSVPRGRYMPVDARHFRQFEEENGPIAVVLDHDGNPPEHYCTEGGPRCDGDQCRDTCALRLPTATPEPLWLDADQLDELPHLTVVLPRDSKHVRQRLGSPAGPTWFTPGRPENQSSESIAPARLLWAPEAER